MQLLLQILSIFLRNLKVWFEKDALKLFETAVFQFSSSIVF